MGLDKGDTMKKYLFGLGSMLVGAGLMFVLMHGEVSADSKLERPERFVCSEREGEGLARRIYNCKRGLYPRPPPTLLIPAN